MRSYVYPKNISNLRGTVKAAMSKRGALSAAMRRLKRSALLCLAETGVCVRACSQYGSFFSLPLLRQNRLEGHACLYTLTPPDIRHLGTKYNHS